MVREYRGRKFLSTSKDGSFITKVDDISQVQEATSEDEGDTDNLQISKTHYWEGIRVSGVLQLNTYSGCMKCKAKVLPLTDDPEFGQCVKCQMMQCMADVNKELSAQLLIKLPTGQITLRAFGKTILDIAQRPAGAGDISQISLLKAAPFNMSYKNGIIQTVTRKI